MRRTLDALPDTIDFRDTIYIPTLVRVAPASDIDVYRGYKIPLLDQGREGACTGFGLATIGNYLSRVRGQDDTAECVSPRMLYAMAKRYDEWPGETYEGSSARGAMKGWHKHGLCAQRLWDDGDQDNSLTSERAADATKRPLGAYFRVNHRDLVAMHSAITEVGVIYATSNVHAGWQTVRTGDSTIPFRDGAIGGHAFAIVGYNRDGFWIQNSWGVKWAAGGLALLSYADWLTNGHDVWVASLGAPVVLASPLSSAAMRASAPRSYESQVHTVLQPHIITAKNDGILDEKGVYGLTHDGLRDIIRGKMKETMGSWDCKRVLLYAHGGLVPFDSAIQTVANNREALLHAQVYPLSFIWRSDAWNTIGNILRDAFSRRRDEGLLDKAKDFMLDRVDDTLEPLARIFGGKALWDEMKENAQFATTRAQGAARLTADQLIAAHKAGEIDELHLVGHSAGAIVHAPLAKYLVEGGVNIKTLSLWAPACTMALFKKIYQPLIEAKSVEAFDLYTLDDTTERDDDCARIYNKSLLYLVSAALEVKPRIFGIGGGTPLLGLALDAASIPASFWTPTTRKHLVSPGASSQARHHGDFDNDPTTLTATLERITGIVASATTSSQLQDITKSMASRSERKRIRQRLDIALTR